MPANYHAWGSFSCPQPGEVAGVWPWDVSRNQAGELTVGQYSVSELASEYGSSFRFLDLDDLISRATVNSFAWAEEFWDGYGFAGVDICFPVRLCPIPEALRAFVDLGFKLRTGSSEELSLLADLNISFTNVVFELSDSNSSTAARFISSGGTVLTLSSVQAMQSLRNQHSDSSANLQIIWQVSVAELDSLFQAGNDFENILRSLDTSQSITFSGIELDFTGLVEDFSSLKELLAKLLKLRHSGLDSAFDLPLVGVSLNGQIQKYAANQIVVEPVYLARELASLLRESCDIMGDEVPRFSVTMGQWLVSPSIFSVCGLNQCKPTSKDTGEVQKTLVVSDFGVFPRFWSNPAIKSTYRGVVLANRITAEPVRAFKCAGEKSMEDSYLLAPEDVRVGDLLVCPIGDFAQIDSVDNTFVDIFLWHGQVRRLCGLPSSR